MPEGERVDAERERALSAWGITVLRYSNLDIKKNFNGVVQDLLNRLELDFSDLKD